MMRDRDRISGRILLIVTCTMNDIQFDEWSLTKNIERLLSWLLERLDDTSVTQHIWTYIYISICLHRSGQQYSMCMHIKENDFYTLINLIFIWFRESISVRLCNDYFVPSFFFINNWKHIPNLVQSSNWEQRMKKKTV